MKKNLLSILSAVFLGMSANAQTYLYSNDFSTAPTPGGSGAFTHAGDGSVWTITAAGHGEWDVIDLEFPTPLNFKTSGAKPVVSITATTDQTVAFSFTLMDGEGNHSDAYGDLPSAPTTMNIIKDASAATFSCNFAGGFDDLHGGPEGSYKGKVDSTNIVGITFRVNAGWASSQWTYHHGLGDAATYKLALNGTIKIDKLTVGEIPAGVAVNNNSNSMNVFPNPATGVVNVTLNNPNSELQTVSISNVLGQQVYNNRTSNSNITVDLSGLEKGLYLVSTQSTEGITTKRLFLN